MKKSFFLIILIILAMSAGVFVSVWAQDIDVDSMDNEQLTTLLQQILNKLEQTEEEDPEETLPSPTATMIPEAKPEPSPEAMEFTIYKNKKLTVEALPGYMFVQPTKEGPKPGQETQPEHHYFGEPCSRPDVTDRECYWTDWGGEWACRCPRG